MPRYNLSSPAASNPRVQQQALDQQQQQLDQSQQNDWIHQIATLAGVQQQQQMLPGQLQAQQLGNTHLGLQNTAQGLENDYYPSLVQSQIDTRNALAGLNAEKAGPDPHRAALMVQYGIWTPDQAREYMMSPEQRAAAQATAQQKEAERQAKIARDQAQQASVLPPGTDAYNSGYNIFHGASPEPGPELKAATGIPEFLAPILHHGMNVPAAIYNMHNPAIDYMRGILGLPEELVPAGDQMFNYDLRGLEGYPKGTRRKGEQGSTQPKLKP